MRFLVILLLLIAINSWGQGAYQRLGIGVQVFESTGINGQLASGFFTDNNSSFGTYGVWELGVGLENVIGVVAEKKYAGGDWIKGGVRVDLNYLYPLLTVKYPLVLQTYVGTGLQTGTRKYEALSGTQSNFSTGANFMIRVELVTHGIDMGSVVWFFSIYSDIKYHTDFFEHFNYISPVLGVRLRKGR